MSEAFMPVENRGVRYESSTRPCDDPHIQWLKIRNPRLWAELEERQRKEEQKTAVAPAVKPK
jgi:hypothetical protein